MAEAKSSGKRFAIRLSEIVKGGLLVVIGLALGIAYFVGAYHAFTRHGAVDGFLAVFIPPYAIYRGAELSWHADSRRSQESSSGVSIYEIHCKEPLPIFTLGKNSHPTQTQEAALCACIWGNLGEWGREAS